MPDAARRPPAAAPGEDDPPMLVTARIVDVRVDIDWKGPQRLLGYDLEKRPIWDLVGYHSLALGKVYLKIAWDLSAQAGGGRAAAVPARRGRKSRLRMGHWDGRAPDMQHQRRRNRSPLALALAVSTVSIRAAVTPKPPESTNAKAH